MRTFRIFEITANGNQKPGGIDACLTAETPEMALKKFQSDFSPFADRTFRVTERLGDYQFKYVAVRV